MSILHVPVTASNLAEWVRRAAGAINQLITGKQDKSDNLTSLSDLDLTGHSGDAVVVLATEDGFELSAVSGGSGIADGDYGDITASGSGTVLTIDTDAVTYAKIQNVSATDKLLGRSTAGAGDIEEIACTAAGRALLDDADASAQRTTLGLVIGTDVQAYDADLAAVAGLSSNGLVARTGAGTAAARTITAGTGISVTNGDGVSGNPTIAVSASPALVLISEQTPSGTGTVTFSSIAATYRDLVLVVRGRSTDAAVNVNINVRFNNDSSAIYDRQFIRGAGSTASAGESLATTAAQTNFIAAGGPANAADAIEYTIFNYRDTTFQKVWQANGGWKTGTASTNLNHLTISGWYRSTSAITRVDAILSAGNFVSGSVVSLYGRM